MADDQGDTRGQEDVAAKVRAFAVGGHGQMLTCYPRPVAPTIPQWMPGQEVRGKGHPGTSRQVSQ